MLASLLTLTMGDKPLAWASKLPISAASFVGSLFSFFIKKVFGFCGSILFTLGLMFFFQTSSMLIFSLYDKLINNYMAAIILSSSLTLWKLIYMLHKYISTQRLNTHSNSHIYEERHDKVHTTRYDRSTPHSLHNQRYQYPWGRKGFGDADSGARFLRRSSRSFLTDETNDLGEWSSGRCFSALSLLSSLSFTISLPIRWSVSCLFHESTHTYMSSFIRASLCYVGSMERKLCHGGGRGSTFLVSRLHGLSWRNALMLLKERWMRLFRYANPMGRLSICSSVLPSAYNYMGLTSSPLPESCFFPCVWREVPIFKCPSSTRCQPYHLIRTRLWRECRKGHAHGARFPANNKSSPSCCSWHCRALCWKSCLLSPSREVSECASPGRRCPEERFLSRQLSGSWQLWELRCCLFQFYRNRITSWQILYLLSVGLVLSLQSFVGVGMLWLLFLCPAAYYTLTSPYT